MKTKLIKFHFIILLILVINFIITLSFDFGLNNYIKITLKILLYGSALVGSILFFKPFKIVTSYFSLYVISPLLIFLGWLADGILGMLLSGIFLGLFYTPLPTYTQENYVIQESAFMGSKYEVYENHSIFIKSNSSFDYTELINLGKDKVIYLPSDLEREEIKNIKIENDSIFINFKDNSTRSFQLY